MEKKRVLLINSAIYVPGEGGYKRTMYLFDMMRRMGYQVTLLTGDFNHYAKKSRNVEQFYKDYPDYSDLVMIHMIPYEKNISLKRYLAGRIYSMSEKNWVKKHINEYDVVMISMPQMNTIIKIHSICKKAGVKVLVDVRDLRPEAFRVIIKNELLYRLLTFGMKRKADRAYSYADEMIAVSNEYLQRGLACNSKCKNPSVIYIGSALEEFDEGVKNYGPSIEKPSDELWVTYAGTLGASYDLTTLICAAKEIQEKPNNNIRIKILGQGPDESKLRQLTNEKGISIIEFLGFKPYKEMAAFLSKSDMTINSVKKNASQSIINKVADYLAAGIPMINGCACKEQIDMVEEYNVGVNYEPENVDSLIEAIMNLANDPEQREIYGINARELAMKKFNRSTSYMEIIKRIEEM